MPENQKDVCPSREKYWSELDNTGKIDRMRKFVKMLMQENEELKKKVENLEKHEHHDGKMMLPFDHSNNLIPMGGRTIGCFRKNDERYF